ncbi:terminase large subunit [Alteriqipengyuania flavescens]|uniref:terminase large subunit n=1 Tax=Alteriqipengyuania flavescens TaxID=3053610 RepID=UPI0025B5C687|nr:terminase TerL endonuclease subunit [Alteriqipengyuania flavescens]WJY17500.1 terminase large subunit [Alteriqipengyuania flavescens]WJY23443.1 terminase large subunit [Alteriqipengyuania flavescens]
MGARGPGASRQRKAAANTVPAENGFPWEADGLSRAERVIAFIESLPITKGYGAGENVELLPFQRDWIEAVYAVDGDGNRRVRTGLMSVARGQGKTVLAALLTLCHLCGPEAEQRGECYSAAATKEQAGLIFAEMEAIILATPWMADRLNVQRFYKIIEDAETGSKYRALASDGKAVHGTASSFIVCDELAQWKKRELFDVLRTSMGKRKEPLLLAIGTQSPHPENLMSELVDYAERVNSGEIEDAAFHGVLYAVPEDADPYDPENWPLANPAIGVFVSAEQIANEAERAQRMPTFEPAFLNLHCNMRVDAEPKAINPKEWDACGEAVPLNELRGKRCYAGLDLSSTRDLSALVLYFPESGAVLPYFWCPKAGIDLKEEVDRVPYRTWAKQGFIEATPGKAIDKRYIAHRLAEIASAFDVRAIAYDRHAIEDLNVILDGEGVKLPLEPWGQGFVSMAGAIDAFEMLLLEAELKHGMHPVLRWNASNLIFDTDQAGNRKPNKARSIDRIDGMAALIMACGIAAKGEEKPAAYEGSGLEWV